MNYPFKESGVCALNQRKKFLSENDWSRHGNSLYLCMLLHSVENSLNCAPHLLFTMFTVAELAPSVEANAYL